MARQSVVPDILRVLEPYLDKKDKEWWNQVGDRHPTLPTTSDCKVNVRQLVEDIGLKPSYVQHFFNKKELADPVNALASVQNVATIGSRAISKSDEDVVIGEMAKMKNASKGEHEAFLEAIAENAKLRQENEQFRAMLSFIQETGGVLR